MEDRGGGAYKTRFSVGRHLEAAAWGQQRALGRSYPQFLFPRVAPALPPVSLAATLVGPLLEGDTLPLAARQPLTPTRAAPNLGSALPPHLHIGLSRPSIGPFGSWHVPRLPNPVNRSEREAPEVVPGDAEDAETRAALPAREAQLPLALRVSPPYRIRPALPGPPRPRVLGRSGPRRPGVVRRRGLNVGGQSESERLILELPRRLSVRARGALALRHSVKGKHPLPGAGLPV